MKHTIKPNTKIQRTIINKLQNAILHIKPKSTKQLKKYKLNTIQHNHYTSGISNTQYNVETNN